MNMSVRSAAAILAVVGLVAIGGYLAISRLWGVKDGARLQDTPTVVAATETLSPTITETPLPTDTATPLPPTDTPTAAITVTATRQLGGKAPLPTRSPTPTITPTRTPQTPP